MSLENRLDAEIWMTSEDLDQTIVGEVGSSRCQRGGLERDVVD